MTKLETCIRGMIESQSFSLWAFAFVFAFLKDSGCAPKEAIFHQLISSLHVSLSSQAKASFASTSFLKQNRHDTLVSHLPTVTYASVKHAVLTTPSLSSLSSEDVIRESLTQVKEDSLLKLLKNISSSRGGKQTASSASSWGQRRGFSSAPSSLLLSSAYAKSSSWSSKHPASSPSSPARGSKVAFKSISPFALEAASFPKVGAMSLASQGRRLPFPSLDHLEGQGSGTMGGRGVEDGISPPLLIASSSLSGSGALAELLPYIHQGDSSSWRSFGSSSQGSYRASSLLSMILQPSFCCVEGLVVVKARERPVSVE